MRGNKLYNDLAIALADSSAPLATQTAIARVLKVHNPAFKTQYFFDYIDKRKEKLQTDYLYKELTT